MFVGKRHIHGLGFGDVPEDLLFPALSLVTIGVFRSLLKPFKDVDVADAGFFREFSQHGALPVLIVVFDVTLGEVPMALRVLKQQHGAKVDQHHAARGLHDASAALLVHGRNGESSPKFDESGPDPRPMAIEPLAEGDVPYYHRIVADSDMDGLFGAAVLKAYRPEAEVLFSHAAAVRSGLMDELVDRSTALVDLPFHPQCGWYVDHHLTNRPSEAEASAFAQNGGTQHWEDTPSAARLAYELLANITDMRHLAPMMPVVDALDSGGITKEDFIEDGPLLQLSRTCTSRDPAYMLHLVDLLTSGASFETIVSDERVRQRMDEVVAERTRALEHVAANTTIVDRLAICRFDETPLRSNGYLVTAWAGDRADACCIVHGYADGDLSKPDRPPLSASFYANSFLPEGQGRFDLSRLATALDPTGGGHVNACGCRIQPPGLAANLEHWLSMWAQRDDLLAL